ncbi:MAG: HAMP domain-containing protein [Candidatus Odinarchaeota archaeon]
MFPIQRPISFSWIILLSLIFFSIFPIVILQAVQLVTLPREVEQDHVERSVGELNLSASLIQQTILRDAEKLSLLATSGQIVQFLASNGTQDQSMVINELNDLLNSSVHNLLSSKSSRMLEIGIDLIEKFSPSSTDFSSDSLKRLMTLSYNRNNDQYDVQGEQPILEVQNYYPYTQIKAFYPEKILFSSSIRQHLNFMTGEAILDAQGNAIPVNVHSRIIQDNQSTYLGLIYSVNTADYILDIVDELSDDNKPAILTNRAGSVFYSDNNLIFTEVTGYYKTILESEFGRTIVDRDGYKGEITIYHQIVIDSEQDQTILIAKVLPRNVIFRTFQNAIIQSLATIIISACLAAFLGFITTRWLTNRMRTISRAVEQISKGDFSVKLDLNGTDEIANLNRSFHRMTKNLKVFIDKKDE